MGGGDQVPVEELDDLVLIRVIQSEDRGSPRREAAQAELVARYRPVVVSCAARYRHSPESQDDLIQVGFVGLLNAVRNFDPEAGSSLLAYARPCISGEIKRHFRDRRWQFHVRRSSQELRARLRAAQSDLAQQLSRVPTQREIAEHLGISAAELADAYLADAAFEAVSLDAPIAAGAGDAVLGSLLGAPDPDLEIAIDMDAVWEHMAQLPEREQEIISLRFYGNMTQSQIAQRLGMSQMHVSRLLRQALGKLRGSLAADVTQG